MPAIVQLERTSFTRSANATVQTARRHQLLYLQSRCDVGWHVKPEPVVKELVVLLQPQLGALL